MFVDTVGLLTTGLLAGAGAAVWAVVAWMFSSAAKTAPSVAGSLSSVCHSQPSAVHATWTMSVNVHLLSTLHLGFVMMKVIS